MSVWYIFYFIFLHFRHTLIGLQLDVCDKKLPRVYTSLLSRSALNFVMKEMQGTCGHCGVENEGDKLNKKPWFVSIREKVEDSQGVTYLYYTGTLVSKEHVVTAASVFQESTGHMTPVDVTNYEALVATTDYELLVQSQGSTDDLLPDFKWSPIVQIQIHPSYAAAHTLDRGMFDVAVIQLKIRDDFKPFINVKSICLFITFDLFLELFYNLL